ncbi:hypothetical protein CHS0354_040590 [Potamilus streckersoni]|uniref:Uncharacterized protein n=1 Tax=Potamilus streckersoni TaxID=2493646 RepID=A0AAE0VUZ8_9BIVA|nr:hypothetical protein CHS0354_040590 [Potamilus streckersoni]
MFSFVHNRNNLGICCPNIHGAQRIRRNTKHIKLMCILQSLAVVLHMCKRIRIPMTQANIQQSISSRIDRRTEASRSFGKEYTVMIHVRNVRKIKASDFIGRPEETTGDMSVYLVVHKNAKVYEVRLTARVSDEQLGIKLQNYRVEVLSPIRRKYYYGLHVGDGTHYVKYRIFDKWNKNDSKTCTCYGENTATFIRRLIMLRGRNNYWSYRILNMKTKTFENAMHDNCNGERGEANEGSRVYKTDDEIESDNELDNSLTIGETRNV